MTRLEFEKEMTSLCEAFGEKKFLGHKKELLWNKFEKIPYDLFKQCVNKLISYENFAPTMAHFDFELSTYLDDQKDSIKAEMRLKNDCTNCKGEGFYLQDIQVTKLFNYGMLSHAWQCDCIFGKKFQACLPKFLGHDFYLKNEKYNRQLK